MTNNSSYSNWLIILCLVLVIFFLVNLTLGSVRIPLSQSFTALYTEINNSSWQYIIRQYRLPKALTAVIVGSGLGLSGLMLQTLFRNPLAGPFVLGISSGASLGVAILIMGGSIVGGTAGWLLSSKITLVLGASLGSFVVLLSVLLVAVKIRDTMAILIIGLMFGSITAAVVSVLAYFSSAEQLQQYIFWGFGSLGNLSWMSLVLLSSVYLIGVLMCIFSIKTLNSLLLGENYAKSLGTNIQRSRYIIILSTSLLAGSITAFVGPIAFIGLAIPHITRLIIKTSNHAVLMPAVILIGGIVMLFCDSIAQLPTSDYTLPINAITSLVGAPIVIWLLLRKRRMMF